MLEELLDDLKKDRSAMVKFRVAQQTYVVAKDVLNESQGMVRHDLVENNLHFLLIRGFDLLLDKP